MTEPTYRTLTGHGWRRGKVVRLTFFGSERRRKPPAGPGVAATGTFVKGAACIYDANTDELLHTGGSASKFWASVPS